MDREKVKELLPVLQAYAEGKVIQVINLNDPDDEWEDVSHADLSFCSDLNYRVKPEVKLMTNRQLAEWCAKGNGQFRFKEDRSFCIEYEYDIGLENDAASDVLIRRWNSDEWIEPTLNVYLEDCKKEY